MEERKGGGVMEEKEREIERRKAAEAERLRREAEQEMAHYGVSTAEELDEMKEIEDLFV